MKLDIWVSHELSVKNMIDRIIICDAPKRNEIEPFLKHRLSDEKWITYDNWKCKRSWIRDGEPLQKFVKRGLTPSKVILYVWWDWKEIYHELLPVDQTIDSEVYCEQLERLFQAIERKRPEFNNRNGVFNQNSQKFFTDGIMALPEKW